ncbi:MULTISPECIES: Maf family protein [unclassified Akkermansia]|uniref:Maf family protein n=2 Tax=unclassified Akkermansia TaxID=2608915 RepID=UPI0010E9CD04|nr:MULTISPECIES: Maf family protein [unclassified Akkermansia]KAA3147223.1 septum formation protein Maf [Akkermansia sp. BIOML-A67]KAA3147537.1 septum formation protein Maf [Akkermansia sp. BIOML-A64]KAA3155135.1 septum formation protein Maf [Akkermansia sp. BIOML-A65]KAA3170955.1 septum formation protein Maf [Akkermansia sp. BIOML-A61]KAA3175931.1 septum formation protein Maf [Akkermansia sp. BIOML-A53]KAA3185737.1 septum formation protein Maf [Akkermansia sp. BIOML-A55]KAA3199162.1 septum 
MFIPPMLPPIILASQSPRRKDLLTEAGVDFSTVVRETDELKDASMPPQDLCLHNAAAKAAAVFREYPQATVIGADTLVFLDGIPLGKPLDTEDARAMLRMLSGRTHHVCTAVSMQSPLGMKDIAVLTEVTFRELSDADIRRYMGLVHVMDKAGAYAFQEHGDMIISSTRGDTDNVIGLPVAEVINCLRSWGY